MLRPPAQRTKTSVRFRGATLPMLGWHRSVPLLRTASVLTCSANRRQSRPTHTTTTNRARSLFAQLLLDMLDLTLKLLAQISVLAIAAIVWGLDHKWRDRRTRSHRRWIQLLLAAIFLGSALAIATTWDSHLAEQANQQRVARIDEGVTKLVSMAREQNPTLSEQDALNEVVKELRTLRGRTSELQFQLQGLKRYGSVAELNVFALKGMAGSGISESSPLSTALANAYVTTNRAGQQTIFPRCDGIGTAALRNAATLSPDFPFPHWGLAVCAHSQGKPTWRAHAKRAIETLQHTTQIAGHKPDHDQALAELTALLRQ